MPTLNIIKNKMTKKILLVEDDKFLRELLSKRLRMEFYSVLEANESSEAFNHLNEHGIDLILLDLHLPGIPGLEILKEIKFKKEIKNIPVIVFSNLMEEKEMNEAKKLGVSDYIIKANFSLDELVEKINKILK